jgi:hypothetical protein
MGTLSPVKAPKQDSPVKNAVTRLSSLLEDVVSKTPESTSHKLMAKLKPKIDKV